MPRHNLAELATDISQLCGWEAMPGHVAVRIPPLDAVLAGNGKLLSMKERIDVDDRSPAY